MSNGLCEKKWRRHARIVRSRCQLYGPRATFKITTSRHGPSARRIQATCCASDLLKELQQRGEGSDTQSAWIGSRRVPG